MEEPETQFKLAVNTKNQTGQSLKADKQNKISDRKKTWSHLPIL